MRFLLRDVTEANHQNNVSKEDASVTHIQVKMLGMHALITAELAMQLKVSVITSFLLHCYQNNL